MALIDMGTSGKARRRSARRRALKMNSRNSARKLFSGFFCGIMCPAIQSKRSTMKNCRQLMSRNNEKKIRKIGGAIDDAVNH